MPCFKGFQIPGEKQPVLTVSWLFDEFALVRFVGVGLPNSEKPSEMKTTTNMEYPVLRVIQTDKSGVISFLLLLMYAFGATWHASSSLCLEVLWRRKRDPVLPP